VLAGEKANGGVARPAAMHAAIWWRQSCSATGKHQMKLPLPSMSKPRLDPTLIVALAITQMIGWGTTYYLPSMLSLPLQRELGLSPRMVFAAVAAMMITSALCSPMLGRHLDRASARPVMVAGSVLCAAGLAFLSQAQGAISYLAAWVVIGMASVMTLTLSAHAAVVKSYGAEARRALVMLVVAGGWSVTIFWPLTEYLLRYLDWRQAVLTYAYVHLFVAAPIHAIFTGRSRRTALADQSEHVQPPAINPRLDDKARRAGFLLTVLAFAPAGFVSWGLPLHFVAIFQESGIALALAVFLGSLSGPSQMFARILQWLWLDRIIDPVRLALLASLATIPVVALPLFMTFDALFAGMFVVTYGVTSGWTSMARATLPLILFGSGGFATLMGRLAMPLNLIFAVAPMIYAYVMELGGPQSAVFISLLLAIISGLAFVRLARLVEKPCPERSGISPDVP
jgi:predicted MFS family arabinose efflux permease